MKITVIGGVIPGAGASYRPLLAKMIALAFEKGRPLTEEEISRM